MDSDSAINAARHKYQEETFTVYNPGLLPAPPATAQLITCLDSQPARLYCEHRPNTDAKGNHFDNPAIIFEMKGSLRREDFYFTTRGDRFEPGFESDASGRRMHVSCWFGPPANAGLENAVWRQGLRRLLAIGRANGAITSELVRPEPGKPRTTTDLDLLQVHWSPSSVVKADVKGSRKNPMSYMPVYDMEENQRPFKTLEEVPFGARIRVRFTIECGRPEGASKTKIMATRLLAMHIM